MSEATPFVAVFTGGRKFMPEEADHGLLRRLLAGCVIAFDGGAPGFDRYARGVAHALKIPTCTVPAMWHVQGNAAGPLRNERMLRFAIHVGRELMAEVVLISGPGGRGTQDMRRRARGRGLEVRHLRGGIEPVHERRGGGEP